METLVKDETPSPAATAGPGGSEKDRRDEINELLRIQRIRKFDNRKVPCPSCTVPVEITINRCPFCESDIAAETALARETTRRLRELSGALDAEHIALTAEKPKRRGFFQRLKYLFEGDPEPVDAPAIDPFAKRMLSNLTQGDTLRVLAENGPWLQVKTAQGDIGWVYSTVRKTT